MNFTDILDTKVSDIERPTLAPQGGYIMRVSKAPNQDERGDYKIIEFNLQATEATEEVDPDELKEFGKVTSILARKAFLFGDDKANNESTMFNLRRFCEEHLQIEGAEKMTVGELLAASPEHVCMAVLTHKQDKNDKELYHLNVKSTAPVE